MTTPTDAELLPCPFCGSKEVNVADDLITFYGECGSCGATAAYSSYRAGAVQAWNRRAPQAVASGELVACTYGDNGYACCEGGPCQADLHNEKVTAPPPQAVREPQCWCLTCRPIRLDDPYSIRMALCPTCGNKRCPKANDHRNACSNSNEPGQPGSAYPGGITKGGQHGAE